jgi:type II secretory ATPase GspE/PulE/Tfp pilus assembly ATPase PilB-like protein
LSSTLIGVVAQRLVRKICPRCKAPSTPPAELAASFYKNDPPQFYRGAGCEACQGTGFDGTTGLFELFAPDEEMLSRIAAGESVAELQRRAREKGFKPLLADALEKVATGVTSLEEVARRLPPTYL